MLKPWLKDERFAFTEEHSKAHIVMYAGKDLSQLQEKFKFGPRTLFDTFPLEHLVVHKENFANLMSVVFGKSTYVPETYSLTTQLEPFIGRFR